MKLFSEQERRGLLVLMPLLFVMVLLAMLVDRTESSQLLSSAAEAPQEAVQLRPFDPNEDEYEQLRRAGVPVDVAVGIVRWRSYGKIYRMAEDLAQVTGVTDSIYAMLKPYVVIADSLAPHSRYKESEQSQSLRRSADRGSSQGRALQSKNDATAQFTPERFLIDTASVEYLTRWGFSYRQAEVVVRYRDASGGIRSEEQLRRCYVVSDEMASRLLPYIIFSAENTSTAESGRAVVEQSVAPTTAQDQPQPSPNGLLEINGADSAALVAINGIGAKSAAEIIRYRELLGGYHSVEQLSELKIITESNFEKILQQICCDSCKISKIDINFAGPKELERHPYVSAQALRRIIKQRQLKGGWSRIEDLIDDDILSEDEAERLAPYLRFGL